MPDYTPAPQCFVLGAAMFMMALASVLTIRCKHLLPACPVTSIVPTGPIGVCRVSYTYEVASTTYADSMEIDSCMYNEAADGANRTVSICYDTHNAARHEASTDAALLRPEEYFLAMCIMSVGFAIAAMSCCGNMWKRALDDEAAAQQHRYASVSMAVVHHPDATATETEPQQKLRRSDSAMM